MEPRYFFLFKHASKSHCNRCKKARAFLILFLLFGEGAPFWAPSHAPTAIELKVGARSLLLFSSSAKLEEEGIVSKFQNALWGIFMRNLITTG